MKKIVALVLSLALVLALGTVAFAADSVFFGDKIGGETYAKSGDNTKVTLDKFSIGAAAAKTPDTYKVWVTTVTTGAKVEAKPGVTLVLTDEANAQYVFVSGTSITYLMDAPTTYDGVGTAVKTVKDETKATCGDIVSDEALYTVEGKDGKYYKATNTDALVVVKVGDKLIRAAEAVKGEDYKVIEHKMVKRTAKDGDKETVTGLYCSTCKKEFAFAEKEADAIAKFGYGKYEKDPTTGLFYAVAGTAGTPDPKGSNVTSAKTFDAGVAMYAGLALMSVAGSAVVIGKKKEF